MGMKQGAAAHARRQRRSSSMGCAQQWCARSARAQAAAGWRAGRPAPCIAGFKGRRSNSNLATQKLCRHCTVTFLRLSDCRKALECPAAQPERPGARAARARSATHDLARALDRAMGLPDRAAGAHLPAH